MRLVIIIAVQDESFTNFSRLLREVAVGSSFLATSGLVRIKRNVQVQSLVPCHR